MSSWAIAAPVIPGREELLEDTEHHIRAHFDDYIESRRHSGITAERVYLQQTPNGEVVVAYSEGAGARFAMRSMMTSGLKFDAWFFERLGELHGVDLTETQPPETLMDFVHPAHQRGTGMAFCAKLLPGALNSFRSMLDEATGARRAEMLESRSDKKIWKERVYLNRAANAEVVCVYLEGEDPARGNEAFARSTSPFDVWFKERAGRAFGIDFGKPIPAVRMLHDWVS